MKDHVILGATAGPVDMEVSLPPDIKPLRGSEFEIPVAKFLATKNMALPYLPELSYSEKRKRLLIQAEGRWHGRDLSGRSPMKWMNYNVAHAVGWPGPLGAVVVEDLFSKYKTEYALRKVPGLGVVCALGTGIHTSLVTRLAKSPLILWFGDGDSAGDEAFENGRRRMRPFVQHRQVRVRPPDGLDPKDMQCAEIRNALLKEVQHG